MKRPAFAVLTGVLLMAAAIGHAQTISVTNDTITELDGNPVPQITNGPLTGTATDFGGTVATGAGQFLTPQGWTFQFDGNAVNNFGPSTQTFTLTYTVTAAAGMTLTGYRFDPLGTINVAGSSVDVLLSHGAITKDYNYTAQGNLALDSGFHPLNAHSYAVTAVITLTAANDVQAIAALSEFNIHYTEAVPEPASVATVLFGIGGLLVRRSKRSN